MTTDEHNPQTTPGHDHFGVDRIQAELQHQRAAAMAAGDTARADDFDFALGKIDSDIEHFAWMAANDDATLPDDVRRIRHRVDLHENLREYLVELGITLTASSLDTYPLLPRHSYPLHLPFAPIQDHVNQLRRDAEAAGDRRTAENMEALAEDIDLVATYVTWVAETNPNPVTDLEARRAADVAEFESTVAIAAAHHGADLSGQLAGQEPPAIAPVTAAPRFTTVEQYSAFKQQELQDTMDYHPPYYYDQVARQVEEVSIEAWRAGDKAKSVQLDRLAAETRHFAYDATRGGYLPPRAWQEDLRATARELLQRQGRMATVNGPLGPVVAERDRAEQVEATTDEQKSHHEASTTTSSAAAEDDDHDLTAELVVGDDEAVWGGVVMSRAELAAETELMDGFSSLKEEDAYRVRQQEAEDRGEAAGTPERQHDASDVKAAVEQSACSSAVSRASATVDRTARAVQRDAGRRRDEELTDWHADDEANRQAEQTQTAADTDVPW